MPGQRKRKRRVQDDLRDAAARYAEFTAASWQVVFETQDHGEWQEYLRRMRAERTYGDESELRMDTSCGRLAHPTTYRLSVRVPPRQGAVG